MGGLEVTHCRLSNEVHCERRDDREEKISSRPSQIQSAVSAVGHPGF